MSPREESSDPATRRMRALSDPMRRRVLSALVGSSDGRVLVGRLAAQLGVSQPTISHHMRTLLDAGLVEREPSGRQAWFSLAPERSDEVLAALGADAPPVDAAVLERIAADLAERFAGTFSPETVARYVRESAELLERGGSARATPSATALFAADRLSALGRVEHPRAGGVPEVLFVCVQNAGRSQLAAAILRQLAGDRVHVRTAGSAPADAVRATVVAALDEIGVPLGAEFPKPLTDEVVRAADVVVTMGCGDACPVYPGRRYLDWELDDPVGKSPVQVRAIRDEIEVRVRELLATLD